MLFFFLIVCVGCVQVWCVSSSLDQEKHVNRTVDGAVVSILLTGLLPDVRYAVTVAAVTSLGVGTLSSPVHLVLSESHPLARLINSLVLSLFYVISMIGVSNFHVSDLLIVLVLFIHLIITIV